MTPINRSTAAEQTYGEFLTDDTKVAALLKTLGEDDKIGGLLDAVAYGNLTGDWSQAKRWIDNAIDDECERLQAERDAKVYDLSDVVL